MNTAKMRKYIYFSALKISHEKIYAIFCIITIIF